MKADVYHPDRGVVDEMDLIEQTVQNEYKYGFVTEIEADEAPKGLS